MPDQIITEVANGEITGGQKPTPSPQSDTALRIQSALTSYWNEADNARKGGLNPRDDKWRQNLDLYWNRVDFSRKADWQAKETMPEVPGYVDRFAAALKEGEAILFSTPEPYGYRGGLSVLEGSWQRRMMLQERAAVSAALARELGIGDGDLIGLGGEGRASFKCSVVQGAEAKTVALPSHSAALRELMDWNVSAEGIDISPAVVKVSKLA